MPIIVKPISGNLTNDQDNFGNMVSIVSYHRILIALFLLEMKSKDRKLISEGEKNPCGVIHSHLIAMTLF
jgi:hypothetical protein